MAHRYKFMNTSESIDETDGQSYPDVLSATYENFVISEVPMTKDVSVFDINKFWIFTVNNYVDYTLADSLLTLNNIPYIGYLAPGDAIVVPRPTEFINFLDSMIKTEEL